MLIQYLICDSTAQYIVLILIFFFFASDHSPGEYWVGMVLLSTNILVGPKRTRPLRHGPRRFLSTCGLKDKSGRFLSVSASQKLRTKFWRWHCWLYQLWDSQGIAVQLRVPPIFKWGSESGNEHRVSICCGLVRINALKSFVYWLATNHRDNGNNRILRMCGTQRMLCGLPT